MRPSPAAGAISALPFSLDYSEGFSYGRLLAESRMRHEENEKKDRQAAAAAKLAKNQAAAAANLSKNQAAKTKHLREEGFTALSALEDLQTPLLRGN